MFTHQVGFAFLEIEDECTYCDRWHGYAAEG
jgi:hypothetical protein